MMASNNPFVTVAGFTYPHEAAIMKSKLEAEGIGCFLKDELTVQVYNFYSNALGGVKLQVRESDKELAIKILKESGYRYIEVLETPVFWRWFDYHTRHFPVLKNLLPEIRLLIILGTSVFVVLLIYYFYSSSYYF